MSFVVLTHAHGREVYGDEPRYGEEWLSGDGGRDKSGVESVCDPNNLIERRVSPPQFDASGRLVLPPNTDITHGTALAAFMDCLLEGRPYCSVTRSPPAKTVHPQIPWPEVEHERAA